MLASVNLTKGYDDSGVIEFSNQIKFSSPQNATKEQRANMRDVVVSKLRESGMTIDGKNNIYLGAYKTTDKCFVGITAEEFLKRLATLAIAKKLMWDEIS